jgi:hypothetical protein
MLGRVGSTVARRSAAQQQRWLQSTAAPGASATNAATPMAQLKDDFLDGSSVGYLEQLEAQAAADPTSVHRSWASYLTQLGARPTVAS